MPIYVLHWQDDLAFQGTEELTQEHRSYFRSNNPNIVMAVVESDEAGKMIGRTTVIDLPSRADAEAFVANEPYARAGKTRARITEGRIMHQRPA